MCVEAWLAGLVDGEGSIMLSRRYASLLAPPRVTSNYARRIHYRASCVVYNTDIRLMEVLKERTGWTTVYQHTRPERENRKRTSYSWRLNADGCRLWLPRVLPWLVIKRSQAELLLEALAIADRHTARVGQPHMVDPTALRRRDEIVAEISALNRKGRLVSSQGGDAL